VPEEQSFQEVHEDAIKEIAELAGIEATDVFMYSEHPTPTQGRWFFQPWVGSVPGLRRVCLSRKEANATVKALLVWCRAHPDEAKTLTENYRM
jgi:hypothetical protein